MTVRLLGVVLLLASTPAMAEPSMGDQIGDWVTKVGGDMNHHIGVLSHDTLQLRLDGRKNSGYLGVHVTTHYVSLHMDENIRFGDSAAHLNTRLEVDVGGHSVCVQLPDVDVAETDYHGERGATVTVPLLQRTW
jgi:hypothetical protein